MLLTQRAEQVNIYGVHRHLVSLSSYNLLKEQQTYQIYQHRLVLHSTTSVMSDWLIMITLQNMIGS